MMLGRMVLCQSATGGDERDHKSSRDTKKITLQKDLPTDFAG
jgi:hypothetical protein